MIFMLLKCKKLQFFFKVLETSLSNLQVLHICVILHIIFEEVLDDANDFKCLFKYMKIHF